MTHTQVLLKKYFQGQRKTHITPDCFMWQYECIIIYIAKTICIPRHAVAFSQSFLTKDIHFFFHGARAPGGPGPPPCGGCMIILRHTTLGRTPLDEWSARRSGFYLTTHNIHNRQTSMSPVGFEPTFPASERLQTHVLDGRATEIGKGHPHIHTNIRARARTHTHTYMHAYIIHTYVLTYVHTYIHTYVRTYVHTYIRTHTHTHTHRHTHR
jgi:hypothetical protein